MSLAWESVPRAGARKPLASLCEAAQCAHWVVRSEAKLRCHGFAVMEGEICRGIKPPLCKGIVIQRMLPTHYTPFSAAGCPLVELSTIVHKPVSASSTK